MYSTVIFIDIEGKFNICKFNKLQGFHNSKLQNDEVEFHDFYTPVLHTVWPINWSGNRSTEGSNFKKVLNCVHMIFSFSRSRDLQH